MGTSVTTFTSPRDGVVVEFTEWDEDGVHRIQSRVVGEVPVYNLTTPVSSSVSTSYGTGVGAPEAVNVEVQKRLQENFLRARGLI